MLMSCHENMFCVVDPLWEESQKVSNADCWCFHYCETEETVEEITQAQVIQIPWHLSYSTAISYDTVIKPSGAEIRILKYTLKTFYKTEWKTVFQNW